jgi:dTDP-4-dehydrorhamnose reductase
MRFLVIGASGFVGRHVLRHCDEAGHPVVGTQSGAKHPKLAKFDLQSDHIQDCLPASFLAGTGRAYAVICAGIHQTDRCRQERSLSTLVNVTNTIELLRDLHGLGIAPVFISTGFIFDGKTGGYREEDRPDPVNEYGRQKVAVEEFISAELPEALVVRLDKVIGDDPSENHLFTEWNVAAVAGRSVVCIAGQEFSPTLVDDVARAIVLACERGLRGVYHVASPEYFSREELARQFLRRLGRSTPVESCPQESLGFADPRPLKTCLDGTKFRRATGMEFTTVHEAMDRFLARLPAPRT